MLLRYFLFVSLGISVIFISSCANNKADEMVPFVDSSCIQTGQIITYNSDIKKILETNCTNKDFGACHQSEADGGTLGLDYTTYEGIKEQAVDGSLEERVFNSPATPMPPTDTDGPTVLTDCELLKLKTWIDNGAPED